MNLSKGGTVSGATTVACTITSIEKDRTVFSFPSHTAKEPRLVIFTRQLPSSGQNAVLRTGFKVVLGDLNADGSARSGNAILEVSIRTPQDQEVALSTEAVAMAVAVLNNALMTANLESGVIPFA